MAYADPVRYDLVLVHSTIEGVHGLFIVDSINTPDVYLLPPEDPGVLTGGDKTDYRLHVQNTDIAAVYTSGGNNRG